MFSRRSSPTLDPSPFAQAILGARAAGTKLIDLTGSNPTEAGLPYDEKGILRALSHPAIHRYHPDPLGLPLARGAVARDWERRGFTVDPARIVLTASTSEAYSYGFKLLCDAGDEVLVPAPSYPLFEHLARYDDVLPVAYRLAYEGGWHIDLDAVKRALGPRTRAIILVSPNNPTGSYTRRDELVELGALGLPLISDEVFEAYPLTTDPGRAPSALGAESVLTLVLGGLSKLGALPQHKLGWITLGGPDPLVRGALERLELIADSYLSVNASVQHGLADLLEVTRPTRAALGERLDSNLATLARVMAGSPVTLLRPGGGWYAILRLPRIATEEDWVLDLLERDQLLVQPGWFYDFADEPYLVVSLLTPEPELLAGAERLLARALTKA